MGAQRSVRSVPPISLLISMAMVTILLPRLLEAQDKAADTCQRAGHEVDGEMRVDAAAVEEQAALARLWGDFNKNRRDRGELDSESGPGSALEYTVIARSFLMSVIERYGVRSIADVGCGDWRWMQEVDLKRLGVQRYVGYDVNEALVLRNRQLYGTEGVDFEYGRALDLDLSGFDLVLVRDLLFHLRNEHILAALKAVKSSGAKLLLATTHTSLGQNADLEPTTEQYLGFAPQPVLPLWGYRPVNLDIPPYCMGGLGLEYAEESLQDEDDEHAAEPPRAMKLYNLSTETIRK